MAQGNGIVTHAKVSCDDGQESRRIAQGLRRCQMKSVQRADRFDREAASGTSEDRFCDTHNETTPCKPPQGEQSCTLLLSRDPSREPGAKYGAAGFGLGKSRRDALALGSNGCLGRRIALKQGSNQGT